MRLFECVTVARTLAIGAGTAMTASVMGGASDEPRAIRRGLGAYAEEAGAREALQKVQRSWNLVFCISRTKVVVRATF